MPLTFPIPTDYCHISEPATRALSKILGVANCYSVMMDEASDCGHQEQVSIVIRYVDCNFVIQ